MTQQEAVDLLLQRFPNLRARVDSETDLYELPHVTFSLLAFEVLDNPGCRSLILAVAEFCNELAESRDETLMEHLVVDVLEGIAQNVTACDALKPLLRPSALRQLKQVEREYFGRA